MSTQPIIISTNSPGATMSVGQRLGRALGCGDVLALVGQLGAGKTYLVKGIARGLGVRDERIVNSPTFVLVNQYDGRTPIYHLDTYRLGSADELLDLGFDETCDETNVVIVEWADRVPDAIPDRALWIHIEPTGETERRFTLTTTDNELRRRIVDARLDEE